MKDYLTQIFSIPNHPIKTMKEVYKLQYIRGLGEFMCHVTNNNIKGRLIYEIWSQSILGRIPKDAWQYTSDFTKIEDALQIKREGLIFFTMRQSFLFDCFYLLERFNSTLLPEAYIFLLDKVCGPFTKRTLQNIYKYYLGEVEAFNVSDILKRHRRLNCKFHNKRLKRVLVVATMNAGKSTLINAITGYHINKTQATACTSHLSYIYNKPYADGLIMQLPDYKITYCNSIKSPNLMDYLHASLNFHSTLNGERICFIDTPGVNYSRDLSHGEITRNAVKENNYDMLLFVSNCRYFGTNDENAILDYILMHTKRPIVFVLNQLDSFKEQVDSIEKMVADYTDLLKAKKVQNPLVIPVSGYAAFLFRANHHQLDESETFDKRCLSTRFMRKYYNLPQYSTLVQRQFNSQRLIHRTGIELLEYVIKSSEQTT